MPTGTGGLDTRGSRKPWHVLHVRSARPGLRRLVVDESGGARTSPRVAGIRLVVEELRADVTRTRKDGSSGWLKIDYGDPKDPRRRSSGSGGTSTRPPAPASFSVGRRAAPIGPGSGCGAVAVRVLWCGVPSEPTGIVVNRALLVTLSASVSVPGCAAIRVRPPGDLGYWIVRDGACELVPVADTYLRYLRYSRGRALGTTEKYAGNLAVFFD